MAERKPSLGSGVALAIVALGFVLVALGRGYLPARFSFDGRAIEVFARVGVGPSIDDSFRAIAGIYTKLDLGWHPMAAAMFTFAFAALNMAIVIRRNRMMEPGAQLLALIGATTFFSVIYLGIYSKDLLTTWIVLAALLAADRRIVGEALTVGAILLYATEFRGYWLLVLGAYVGLRMLIRFRPAAQWPRERRTLILAMVALVAFASLAVAITQGVPGDHCRVLVNEDRQNGLNATTLIRPFISAPEPVGGVVNNVLTMLALFVPIPLATLGGVYYLALALMLFSIWVLIWRSLGALSKINPTKVPVGVQRSIALALGFVVAQAVFEPDYGSALRHLTPLLPLLIHVAWWARSVRQQVEEEPAQAEPRIVLSTTRAMSSFASRVR